MVASEAAGQPGAGWDEAQCIAALAQLEQIQAQIDDLRLAIPRIIEPLHLPSKPATFKMYAQGVYGSQNAVKNLGQHWKSPEIQSIFEHTKKSQTENADLSAGASIPGHGWIERERKERDTNTKDGGKSTITEETEAILSAGDLTRIVEEFHKTHPNIQLDREDNDHIIKVKFVAEAVKLRFHVHVETDANGGPKINAECLGNTELLLAITRCLASRPQANDLKHLLDMIAAYKTVKGTSCAKCSKMLDNALLTPTARRSRKTTGANETLETVWEPFHESCLG